MTVGTHSQKPTKAYLLTDDGKIYSGSAFGYIPDGGTVPTGEMVFTTSIIGYLSTLCDPCYSGQIVIQSFPLIGNYGVVSSDFESETPALSAYIVRDFCQAPSNFRSEGTLDIFLSKNKIPGLYGIDTRALVRRVRDKGSMNGVITYTLPTLAEYADILSNFAVKDAVKTVTESAQVRTFAPAGEVKCKIGLWNFGAVGNIIPNLLARNCGVTEILPYTSAEEIAKSNFDGIVLSNGPGDPAENGAIVAEIKKIMASGTPVFGISLGHQLAAIAAGAKTVRLDCGHRGSNQPVKRTSDGSVFITSQNHGYAVDAATLPKNAAVTFANLNDGSCEGIEYADAPVVTVQFIPEECPGAKDTMYLYDNFISMIEKSKGVR